jgi:VWFA-related protein
VTADNLGMQKDKVPPDTDTAQLNIVSRRPSQNLTRILALLMVLGAVALPAFASKSVTVQQLQQALAAVPNQQDSDVAQLLSDLELTERLSLLKLAQIRAEMPGDKAQQALTAVADRAEFLSLPASEIPATPPPTPVEQRQMMSLVVTYVTKSVHQLPNFFATRETTRFEDRPQAAFSYLPLHFVGSSSRSVIYRDGQEMAESAQGKLVKSEAKEQGLVSWGEFGPILSIVLLDAAQSKLAWSHWEQGASGPDAVFSYEVPSQKSHYLVQSQDASPTDPHEAPGSTSRNRAQSLNGTGYDATDSSNQFRERPGYHGEMKVDPATGTILRVTVDAELALGDPLTRAALMVEYGTVDIGGKAVTCPTRSVALSMVRYGHASTGAHSILDHDPLKTLLNDVQFSQYHQLRSEMRILSEAEAATPQNGSGNSGALQPPSAANAEPAKPAETTAPPAAESSPPASTAKVEEAPPAAATEPAAPTPGAEPPEPEISVGAAGNIPDTPINSTVPPAGSFVLKVTSRLVDVGVVVVDKKGHPVTGLRAEDLAVYDNGRRQEVKFFNSYSVNGSPAAAQPTTSTALDSKANTPVRTYSNQQPSIEASSPASPTSSQNSSAATANSTVLLIDESHIAWADLSNARAQILKFLQGLAPGERVGLYTISGRGFRVLTEITSDHAAVIARLKKWTPSAQSASNGQEDETRNRQQFETVQNASDLNSVNGNQTDAPDTQTPIDPQLLTMGSNPGRASLIVLLGVARHLASVPGHKSLVWIASDNVLVDWTDQSVGVDKNTTSVDSFALHAQEAMNEAHVAVYPMDVSQLEAGGIGADTGNRNVEVNPTNSLNSAPGGSPREMDAGRTKASMIEDLRPIQGPIRQVADATGGRIIRRSGDLVAELGSIVEDGHATYQVGFYPDTPADGQYHTVMLKLVDKKGLSIRGRSGYLYAREPTTLKERFRQAIWQPADAAEIKVTATVGEEKPDHTIKINVATTDLALELRGTRWGDKLDIFFVQRDDAGMHADLEGETLGLRLKQATYDKLVADGVPVEHAVTLKPGTGSLRVLVVDENSGRMGSVTLPATSLTQQ